MLKTTLLKTNDLTDENHGYKGKNIKDELDSYKQLYDTMKKNKYCHPLLVIPNKDKYEILDGWHRWKIAKLLKWKFLPVVITNKKSLKEVWKEMKKLGYIVE